MNWTGSSGDGSGPAAAGTGDRDHRAGIELVAVTDPSENAFTVSLPKGWQNQAYSVRPHGVHRAVVTSVSPDGATALFFGDPQMPDFQEPNPMLFGMPMGTGAGGPLSQVHPYIPAEPFFQDYVRQRFGPSHGQPSHGQPSHGQPSHGQPSHGRGVQITHIAPCPIVVQSFQAEAARRGMQVWVTAVSLSFAFTDRHGQTVRGRLHGGTVSFGPTWVVSVFGLTTTAEGDPARWDDLLFRISNSQKTNPQWRQRLDQQHAHAMQQIQANHQVAIQQMQQNHQNNMQWIQTSAQNHQARMDAIHAAGDARMQDWQAQQTAGDAVHRNFLDALNEQTTAGHGGSAAGGDFSHQRFVNYINEQETVIDPNGNTWQVEAGHERYYKHKRDDTYIGTDNFTEKDDLRQRGFNPDDYDEMKVRR